MLKENILLLLSKLNVDGAITTMQDEHLNEFINDNDNRVWALTGFTGTAGFAYTSKTVNGFITDGRYYLQAERELNGYDLVKKTEESLFWKKVSETATKIGIDFKFISNEHLTKLKGKLKAVGIELVHISDPVTEVWKDRKPREFLEIIDIQNYTYKRNVDIDQIMASLEECGSLSGNKKTSDIFNIQIFNNQLVRNNSGDGGLAGETRESKLRKVLEIIKKDEILILTELDTIAWLFNHRGQDIKNNLMFFAFAVISHRRVILFTNRDIKGAEIRRYEEFYDFIDKEYSGETTKVVVSKNTSAFIIKKFKKIRISEEIRILQSMKNKTELYGMFRSNVHDAISFMRLAAWLEKQRPTENEVSKQLEKFRKEDREYLRRSFDSIVAVGSNAAEPHHTAGSRKLEDGKVVMLDTGSHYPFGSTDITRTLYIGNKVEDEDLKRDYTLVLKGAMAPRLEKTKILTGNWIDREARSVLRAEGIDYDTSTGHGVGFGLAIHESPPVISPGGKEILKRQVLTIEPGVYKHGKYGIRIEDMVYMDGRRLLDLTVIPYERQLINEKELSEEERGYLNERGRQMRCLFEGVVQGKTREYLIENTREL